MTRPQPRQAASGPAPAWSQARQESTRTGPWLRIRVPAGSRPEQREGSGTEVLWANVGFVLLPRDPWPGPGSAGGGRWMSGRRVGPGWSPASGKAALPAGHPVFCAPRGSLGVRRGCWGGLRGGGTLPQKASELKQRGCPGRSGSPGSHGEVQPSGVSSGPLSSPIPHGSTCQSLPVQGQGMNAPRPRLLLGDPAEPPSTPELSTFQSSSRSPGAPRHDAVTRLSPSPNTPAPQVTPPKRSSTR